MPKRSIHDQWSSRLAFILAATGSAVGLGNIWKFPYMAGTTIHSLRGLFLVFIIPLALLTVPDLARAHHEQLAPTTGEPPGATLNLVVFGGFFLGA